MLNIILSLVNFKKFWLKKHILNTAVALFTNKFKYIPFLNIFIQIKNYYQTPFLIILTKQSSSNINNKIH
jgi:hypothetical protein